MTDTSFSTAGGAWYRCPNCVRHHMGARAVQVHDGYCNVCDATLDPKGDRVQ